MHSIAYIKFQLIIRYLKRYYVKLKKVNTHQVKVMNDLGSEVMLNNRSVALYHNSEQFTIITIFYYARYQSHVWARYRKTYHYF